jgi:hypothetical protein
MFESFGNERLIKWKDFRQQLETSQTPFMDVAGFWSKAPFVNSFIDPSNTDLWPDPWHLILDNQYDDLAITLGMLYTIKLTQRFMDSSFEIHTSITGKKESQQFFLVVDKKHVLNYQYALAVDIGQLSDQTSIIWSGTELP